MLTINKVKENEKLTMSLVGRLDTNTAPQFENELKTSLGGVKELVLDLAELTYISSAGLRVLLLGYKSMHGQGSMKLIHVSKDVSDILKATGFSNVLTVE